MSTIFRQVQHSVPQKTPKKPSTCVKNPFFPAILAHRERCPPFRNPVFSNATFADDPTSITQGLKALMQLLLEIFGVECMW